MNANTLPAGATRLRVVALLAAAIGSGPSLTAQTEPIVALDELVVSASRTAQDIRVTPSSVSSISLESLAESGTNSLQTALGQQVGVVVVNSGAVGGQSSVFMRGAASHQTLFVVDGVRMNDRSAAYQNFLGGAGLANIERFEVLRGPQSTLYGSSAMGGVITLDTARGRPGFGGSIRAEAGSFGTYGGTATIGGLANGIGYSGSVSRLSTDNDRPENSFDGWEYSGRMDLTTTENLTLGATVRGQVSDYEEPGSTFFPSPGVIDSDNHLVTAHAEMRGGESVTSKIVLGMHRRDFRIESPFGVSSSADRRDIVDWTTTWAAGSRAEIVGGVNYERSKNTIGTASTRDETLAGFASGTMHVNEALTVTAGVRNDNFDTVGEAATWRAGFSWRIAESTRLRGTYGTGFAAPSAADRFGVAAWGQAPNPDLKPEESRGWDAGIEQDFNFAGLTASATWFDNRFTNLFEWETIDFTTFEGMIVNRDKASTRGLELALSARPYAAVSGRIAYTYLRARDDDTGTRLIRRPEHTLDALMGVQATHWFHAGIGARVVANRVDSTGPQADYATVRVFGRCEINESLVVTARIENLFDKDYEEVAGYPALPFGAYAGLEWRF